jgi:hypothetical protein
MIKELINNMSTKIICDRCKKDINELVELRTTFTVTYRPKVFFPLRKTTDLCSKCIDSKCIEDFFKFIEYEI